MMHKSQRGFTLIELIIAVAITGIIIGGISMTIFHVLSLNARTANHLTAVRQVQNAGYWISRDAKMARIVDAPVATGFPLTLTWTDRGGTVNRVITYTLVGGELRRSHSIGGVLLTETLVAQYIDSIEVAPRPFAGGVLTLNVTATVGGWQPATATRTYKVVPRPSL